jgi:hypothetical protein
MEVSNILLIITSNFQMSGNYLWLVVLGLLLPGGQQDLNASSIDFNRDIRPILTENCLACHGQDPGTREAGLRLDTQEGLFESRGSRPAAVVPKHLDSSELWKRVNATDPDEIMPPPDSGKVLKPEEKELLAQWIREGAHWQQHWAFSQIERPAVPAVSHPDFPIRNPIDAFVLERLSMEGLSPAPEADWRTLARRLSLDLTGLPPEPEAVEAFLQDQTWRAYERYAGRLMDSPHWGEHRARYWLDAARYADTHGLHFDNYREIWPYRDWVIDAFNQNMPFDQFTMEQIAGDLLEDPTDDQLVATGFHRSNITTNEGGTIEEENLAIYANDRVTTTSWVWLGLTANCASCHDHKFDPITMEDFYSMAAFFRNTTQSGLDRNLPEGDLWMLVVKDPKEKERWEALPGEIESAKQAREETQDSAAEALAHWLENATAADVIRAPEFPQEYLRLPLNEGNGSRITARLEAKAVRFDGPEELEWRQDGPLGPAPVLTPERTFDLGDLGDFDAREPFSFGAWVRVPEKHEADGAIIARMAGAEDGHRGWDLMLSRDGRFVVHLVRRWNSNAMRVRTREPAVTPGKWQHVFVVYEGASRAGGVKIFVDGIEAQVNRDFDRLTGSIRNSLPLRLGRREEGSLLEGVAVQDVRIYPRRLDPFEVRALAAAPRVGAILAKTEEERAESETEDLEAYFQATRHPGWQEATGHLLALEMEKTAIRMRNPVTHIQREKEDSEPTAHILIRGEYHLLGEKVGAGAIKALHPMPEDAPRNRLGLAQWLMARENPLTARVTVNRFWQELFGTGIVETSDDFGLMGAQPVNQPLLDWLAVEFIESGWDIKHLFTLMITSSAYRQSVAVTPDKLEKDPANHYLSRGPRFRMDAEMIRDYALAASGLLAPRIGGPSVKPYQPEGVWEAVAMPESNTRFYERDEGEALYRRSLYTFWKRAAPPASMDVLNAPGRETCTVRRELTNTPLQALVTLNDTQFVEAARVLAMNALEQSNGCQDSAINYMAARILARPFQKAEWQLVEETLSDMRAHYQEHPEEAGALIEVGEFPVSDAHCQIELASWTLVANQLLNLDEVLNK